MTVVLSYVTGDSRLLLGVSSIEDASDLLVVSYQTGSEVISKSRVREVRVALD